MNAHKNMNVFEKTKFWEISPVNTLNRCHYKSRVLYHSLRHLTILFAINNVFIDISVHNKGSRIHDTIIVIKLIV